MKREMDLQERLNMIEAMLKENPNDPFLHYAASLEYHKRGNSEKAIAILNQLSKEHPDYLGTYYQLGQYLELSGQTEAAIEAYRKGKVVATAQNDRKILGELNEALMILDADDDEY